jgi:drug/metabolite transporter (DMT)-like permease
MLKTLILVLIAGTLGGTGHVLLSKGMKTVGDLTEAPTAQLAGMIGRAVTSPWLLLGVVLQASFFFMYLTLLSRADVSKILPMTAFDYVIVALLASWLLGEPITAGRWLGIAFVVAGVALVSRT